MITQAARDERGRGTPLDDIQRIARHYNLPVEEASELLELYTVEELLPERGYGLEPVSAIYGGTVHELGIALVTMEKELPIGGKAKIELCTDTLPTMEELDATYVQLTAVGHHVSYPTAKLVDGIPTTEFVIQKGSPVWAALIAALPALFTVGLIGFGIARIEYIGRAIFPIVLTLVIGIVVVVGLARSPAEKYVQRAERKYLPYTEKKVPAAR